MVQLKDILPTASDEHVIYFVRHHWITFVLPIGVNIILAATPLLGGVLLNDVAPSVFETVIVQAFLIIGGSIYYLFLWLSFFNYFLAYYLDVWVVTNKRVIDIQQHSLWRRTISEQPLSRVQDITSDVHGIFPTLFGYGDIKVQTAGAEKEFTFKNIPHPEQMSQAILELIEQERRKNPTAV